MNVASLELCEELFELSGWRSAFSHGKVWNQWLAGMPVVQDATLVDNDPEYSFECPAYDLGFLLRKLLTVTSPEFVLQSDGKTLIIADYRDGDRWPELSYIGDTPEDATAKLAIELFKQGILTKGDN